MTPAFVRRPPDGAHPLSSKLTLPSGALLTLEAVRQGCVLELSLLAGDGAFVIVLQPEAARAVASELVAAADVLTPDPAAARVAARGARIAWRQASRIMDTDHPDDRKAQRLRWEADRLEVVADGQDHVAELQAANRRAVELLRAAAAALA